MSCIGVKGLTPFPPALGFGPQERREHNQRQLSALVWAHTQRGLALDRRDRHIATFLAGIRNSHAQPPRQKEAIPPKDLLAMLEICDQGTLRGLHDRAMLLIGFAGVLRRSEVTGLDAERDQTEETTFSSRLRLACGF